MRMTRIMLASCAGLALAGCAKTDWGAIAVSAGQIATATGATEKIDPKVAEAGRQLERYCPYLRLAANIGATTITNEKARAAALMASAALNEVCARPISDTQAAVIVAARAYEAAKAARIVPPS